MTLTLEIAPETLRVLEIKARRRGLDVDALLVELAQREAETPDSEADAASDDLDEAMRAGAEIMAPLYAESLATGGELTAAINGQEKEDMQARRAAFLVRTKELMPVIEAGALVPPGSVGATELLDAVRDEREAELDAAFIGGARQ